MMMLNQNIPLKYKGMSYEQASIEALKLIEKDGWYKNFNSLYQLFQIMKNHELNDRETEYRKVG